MFKFICFVAILAVSARAAPSLSMTVFSVDCSGDSNPLLLHPHPSDCSQYIQCVHGSPLARPCALGTEFSPSLGLCVHIAESDCTAGSIPEPEPASEEEAAPEPEPEPEPASEEEAAPEPEPEPEPAPEPEPEPEVPESVETTTVSAEPEVESEQEGTTALPELESPTTSASVAAAQPDLESAEAAPEAVDISSICLSDPQGTFFVKNPTDCRSYFICLFGDAFTRTCPDGSYFNSEASLCRAGSCTN
ncbi:uncharacterized protein LOC143200707 [Rhynchophorus ferrugineus]|uniref:uncharacterized protein LOC143200707 n=1 Tax=Rhynchophorus ferrugineus TaxID=354439 RepID=UPI003FCD2CA4